MQRRIRRALVDLSSVLWTSLLHGVDKEFGIKVVDGAGKERVVNSAGWGYESSVKYMTEVMLDLRISPRDLIFVKEGMNSKQGRQAMHPAYKAGRDKLPEQYVQFDKAKDELLETFLKLGSQVVWQDGGVEADDVIGYIAPKLLGEVWIISGDKDLAQCVGGNVHHYRNGERDANPFGPFPHRLIPVYIALVGDQGDKIPGAKGFGEKAFEKLLLTFGEEGLEQMEALIKTNRLDELNEDVGELPELAKVVADSAGVYLSYELGRLRPERVNTLKRPLQWRVGMVRDKSQCEDQLLRKFAGSNKLVHAGNYGEAVEFFRKHLPFTEYVTFDIETSTPPESDAWLETQDKEDVAVDVFGSELTGMSITFGSNMQFTFYLTCDHLEEPGVKNLTIGQMRDFMDLVPREKWTVVHSAGFELPVCYNAWGKDWAKDPEYHGFLRNVRDTMMMSSYADENRSKGLKSLSKEVLGYEQATYEQVTTREILKEVWGLEGTGRVISQRSTAGEDEDENHEAAPGNTYVTVRYKMNELPASHVVHYGCDDAICTAALANHFLTVMEIENTIHVWDEVETFPAYLTALGFIQGVEFSLEEMAQQEKEDGQAFDKAQAVLHDYLIEIGFEGTRCPVFAELTPANIKQAFEIVTGHKLDTQVRTASKLAKLMREWAEENAHLEIPAARAQGLALLVEQGDLNGVNAFTSLYFEGAPQLDLASPKQMKGLLYDFIKMPIRIINDVTPLERQHKPELAEAVRKFKKIRAGARGELTDKERELLRSKAKTDDDAIQFALAFDSECLDGRDRQALEAIGQMKKVMTRRSLFYKNYWTARHWKDGKIHAQSRQCGTVTRRYSYSSPNLQQLPKKGEGVKFRRNFKAHHKDAVVVSIDFTGQELRLAARRSMDKNMLACYIGKNLKDIHSLTAASAMKMKWGVEAVKECYGLWGQGLTEGQDYDLFLRLRALGKSDPMGKKADDLRKDSKNVNFAAQFGGQAAKISETIIMPVEDAQIFLDARSAMFPDVDKAAERAAEFASKHGFALTMLGARRHLQDSVRSEEYGVADRAARQAWNFEIQSSAAEMAKLAMARLWKSGILFRFDARFFAPIHDELVTTVHKDHALEFIRIKHQCMTAQYADMGNPADPNSIPILGSISLGRNFADQEECGDWFIQENIEGALNGIFKPELVEVPQEASV